MLLRSRLKNKISEEGVLKITSQSERTQLANKMQAIDKFEKLSEKALTEPKRRFPATVSADEKEKRLRSKKLIAEKKERRKFMDGHFSEGDG